MMLHTVLSERFAMASTIKYANEEIEKVKAIAEFKGQALREKENQFQEMSRIVQDLNKTLGDIRNNNPSIASVTAFSSVCENVNNLVSSKFTLCISEPIKILSDVEGSGNDFNRLLSYLRERDGENEVYKGKLIEFEKNGLQQQYSSVNHERTISSLRQQNNELAQQIDSIKQLGSQSTGDDIKLKTANAKIQELESQLRTSELQLRQGKDTTSSAATSRINPQSNMVDSQYSSSSSSRLGESATGSTSYGNQVGVTNSTYGTAGTTGYGATGTTSTYGQGNTSASTYGQGNTSGSTYGQSGTTGTTPSSAYGTSGARGTTTSTYGNATGTTSGAGLTTSGTASGTGLSASGAYRGSAAGSSTSGTYGTSGTTGVTGTTGASNYGTSGATGATGTSAYGSGSRTYGSSATTGTTGTANLTSGTTSTSAYQSSSSSSSTTYGQNRTGTSATYGQTGVGSSSSGSATYGQSGASSSGRQIGGAGSSSTGSSYNFQTKKY